MSTLVRELATGETMIFDKNKRELFIVPKGERAATIEDAKKLHTSGKASVFTKSQLGAINSALSHIVLLGE
jgi:hypothetical protein